MQASVKQAMPGRELYTFECQGVFLHGTYHLPPPGSPEPSHTGILILPGFPMPRSGHGDAAVCWADACAALGYPAFRIDLPGLGDSQGNLPAELLAYTATGGYQDVAAEAIRQIVKQYQLTGLVILGQCAGAVSAIFAAALARECRGLILLDPPFHLPPPHRPNKVKLALSYWATRNRIGGLLSNLYDQLRRLRLRMRNGALPENANIPLLKRWKSLTSAGLPILLLTAPVPKAEGAEARVGRFDYLTHILNLAGEESRVSSRLIPGANHSFSNILSKEAVPQQIAKWMPGAFPVKEPTQEAVAHASSVLA